LLVLAVGFLLSEGVITGCEQVVRIASHPRNTWRNVIAVLRAGGVEPKRII